MCFAYTSIESHVFIKCPKIFLNLEIIIFRAIKGPKDLNNNKLVLFDILNSYIALTV
jgi:hypothetical protein